MISGKVLVAIVVAVLTAISLAGCLSGGRSGGTGGGGGSECASAVGMCETPEQGGPTPGAEAASGRVYS